MSKLNNIQAAEYIGFMPSTLRLSRCIGRIAGVAPPKFKKIGSRVVYDTKDLDDWLEQFPTFNNNAEAQHFANTQFVI